MPTTMTEARKVTRIERHYRLSSVDGRRVTDFFIYAHTGGFEVAIHAHRNSVQLSVWNAAIGTFVEARISRTEAAALLRKFRKLAK